MLHNKWFKLTLERQFGKLFLVICLGLQLSCTHHAVAAPSTTLSPEWIEQTPKTFLNNDFLVGVGQGHSYQRSDAAAVANIAQQIRVSVNSQFSNRQVFEDDKLSQSLVKENKTKSAIKDLAGIRFEKRHQSGDQYYTLAVLDKQAYKATLSQSIKSSMDRFNQYDSNIQDWAELTFAEMIASLRPMNKWYLDVQKQQAQIQLLFPDYAVQQHLAPRYEPILATVRTQLNSTHQGVQSVQQGFDHSVRLTNQLFYQGKPIEGLETHALVDMNGNTTQIATAITDEKGESVFQFNIPKSWDTAQPMHVEQSLFQDAPKLLSASWQLTFFNLENSAFVIKDKVAFEGVDRPLSMQKALKSLGLNIQNSINDQYHYILELALSASVLDDSKRIKVAPVTGFINVYAVSASGEQTLQQSYDVGRFNIRYAGLNAAQLENNAQKALKRVAQRLKAQLKRHLR